MISSGGTPYFAITPARSVSLPAMVSSSVTCGPTSCAMSLSLVEMIVVRSRAAAWRARVPMTSSALHAGHDKQRHAHGADDVVNRRDLVAQVVRHGRAVGLVVGVQIVAEGLALGVEDDRNGAAGIVGGELAQHGDDAPHRPGRAAVRGLEWRQGVVGAEQVSGPVHQNQGFVIRLCRCFCHYFPKPPCPS